MGNHQSSLEKEAQSIISRVWDDDPSTKEASIDFARQCLDNLSKLDALRSTSVHGSPPPPRIDATQRSMLDAITVLDTYLDRMVKKLYLQCDRRTGKFDHPLLFRFWRYDPIKEEYAQTRSGRGLSICTGQPRAMHVLRSEPLIQELEVPLPCERGTPPPEVEQQSSQSANADDGDTQNSDDTQSPSTNTGILQDNNSLPQQPVATVMPDNPFQPFSVPVAPGGLAGVHQGQAHTQDDGGDGTQQQQAAPVVLYNPTDTNADTSQTQHCRRVCLVFRGDVVHPLARLRDFPLSGGVLDLVLLKENDTFHADLIDDAQVRMLSAHSVIGRNANYINLLYRLATYDTLATLRNYSAHRDPQNTDFGENADDSQHRENAANYAENAAQRLVRHLSRQLHFHSHVHSQHVTTSIANRAWNILTSLREPRSHARLLVDIFDQAMVEQALSETRAAHNTHVLEEEAVSVTAARRSVNNGSTTTNAQRARTSSRSLASKVLSHMKGCGRQSYTPIVTIKGGLPMDLARLIDSFVPNQVQSMVMNV